MGAVRYFNPRTTIIVSDKKRVTAGFSGIRVQPRPPILSKWTLRLLLSLVLPLEECLLRAHLHHLASCHMLSSLMGVPTALLPLTQSSPGWPSRTIGVAVTSGIRAPRPPPPPSSPLNFPSPWVFSLQPRNRRQHWLQPGLHSASLLSTERYADLYQK